MKAESHPLQLHNVRILKMELNGIKRLFARTSLQSPYENQITTSKGLFDRAAILLWKSSRKQVI